LSSVDHMNALESAACLFLAECGYEYDSL